LRIDTAAKIIIAPVKTHIFIFAFAVLIFGTVSFKAQDNVDPDTRAQIEAAKKNAEKMGVKMPDIDKMMAEDAEEDAAAKKEVANKTAATKPEPLASLPSWIPPIDGFQPTTGSGKHWIDNEGKEQGTMRGIVSGDPHVVFKSWEKLAKPKFSGGDTAWEPTIGDMNGRHYVSLHAFRRDAQGADFCDLRLELESAKSGKSNVTFTYIQPAAGCVAAEKK
jgi:hypothetical protein